MSSLEEIKNARLKKLEHLRSLGVDPYPAKVPRDFAISEFKQNFVKHESSGKEVSLVGRIMAIRGQGAILFVVLFDGTDKVQTVFKKDEMAEEVFNLFVETADIGDFVSVSGLAQKSKTGEESLFVKNWVMATKSLLPLPEKWAGLVDDDTRYRKRYLDLLVNNETRDLLIKKSKFWDVTRNFLKHNGFLEVETPTLEVTTGGAEARPFKTHHNDFDIDLFLRISVGELWQKRLMAAGFPKTFEIGRVYRNEGSSPEHLQEFTNVEFYWSFADYRDGMNLVKELYILIAKEVFGKTEFEYKGHKFDLSTEWQEIDYVQEIKKQTGVDINLADEAEIKEKLKELGVKWEGDNKERLTDTLWKYCRKNISGPAFLVNHPSLVAPLAKKMTSSDFENNPLNPPPPGQAVRTGYIKGETEKDANSEMTKVQMFQPIIAGSEVGRGYSELNDAIDQKERFDAQKKLLEAGDEEAMMSDYEFVEMLEHGMPPTCGFGFGERLFAILADKPLRELQTFPLMRPKI